MSVNPTSSEPPDWDVIARHLAGESDGDDVRALAAWLAAHPGDAELLAALDLALSDAARAESGAEVPDVEAALRAVRARMHRRATVLTLPSARVAANRGRATRRWIGVGVAAAAAAMLLAVGLRMRAGSVAVAPAGSAVATAVGGRDSVRLPDDTRVVLAPGSRLVVAKDYGRSSREVTLEGAAYFSVRHDAAVPFTVHAGDAVVRDLGTAFTVRVAPPLSTGAGVATASVAVTEGRVELRARSSSSTVVVLAAGDRGQLQEDGQLVAERGAALDDDLAWMRGRLVFHEATMAHVRADLQRWYGLELRIEDAALQSRRLTATFDDEPVDRVLQVIALALGADVERQGSVAVLRAAAPR